MLYTCSLLLCFNLRAALLLFQRFRLRLVGLGLVFDSWFYFIILFILSFSCWILDLFIIQELFTVLLLVLKFLLSFSSSLCLLLFRVASNLLLRVSFLSCPVLVLLPVSDYLIVFSCCYPTLLLVFIVLSFFCQSFCLCPVLCIPEFYVYSLGHFGGFGGRLKPVTCLRIFKAFSSDWAGCRLCSHITYVRPDLPVTAKKWASKGEQSVCSCVSEVHVTTPVH